jgi:hypothetical protein
MKIPDLHIFLSGSIAYKALVEKWKTAAEELSLETGVYVEVDVKHKNTNLGNQYMSEIIFKVSSHEFAGLADVKKAIANKAFL